VLSFEDLTDARRSLQSFCLLHFPSILALQSGISFKLLPAEDSLDGKAVHHLTTTATCFTSLFDSPPGAVDLEPIKVLRSAFAKNALLRLDWQSEGSAGVYCRCRALPAVIRGLSAFDKAIEKHLRVILVQLRKKPERFGIGEAGSRLKPEKWYPPNAFHTYWILEIFDLIETIFKSDFDRLSKPRALNLKSVREGMLVWARQQLGYQIGLHSASPQSSLLDSDQLAWSLAIFFRFDRTLSLNLETRDFIKQAFKCLFSTQVDGTWRHYRPLFHYKESGNAYCYVFETFAALLQCVLRPSPEAEMFRELLEPYCQNLMDLWRYADSTQMDLWHDVDPTKRPPTATGKEIGWCSGHRTNITSPESWATASVFSYAQALRRLIGIWCREQVLRGLRSNRSRLPQDEAAKRIVSRGETWGVNKTQVAERLRVTFINPVRMHVCDDKLEPDSQPIEESQARSAILFGPPGTSKTALTRFLADAIGWDYVELHASHFVAEGLTAVQKTADKIFKQLLELDHTVVLFDEIDELVRERDMEKDAFGRFLTTSMLPKLAELWEARKILYFVATNHINYFDSAIIRSHRFDALILVSPPSCSAKIKNLTDLLSDVHDVPGVLFEIKEQQVQEKLDEVQQRFENVKRASTSTGGDTEEMRVARWRDEKLDTELTLAKFALLRHDELDELAYRLASILKRGSPVTKTISHEILTEALKQVEDSEWRKTKSYLDYLRDTRSERRDYQMLNVWEVSGAVDSSVPGIKEANGIKWLLRAVDFPQDIKIFGFDLHFIPPGRVEFHPLAPK